MTTASRFRLKSARRGPGKSVSRCPASSAAASLEAVAAAAAVLAEVLGEEELEEALEEELAGLEVDMGVQSSAEGMGVTEVLLAEGSMGYPSAAVAAMEGLLVVGDFMAEIILTLVTKAEAAAVTMTLAVQAMAGNIAIKYF